MVAATMSRCDEWSGETNLELCWMQDERGVSEKGVWTAARGLVWSRKPYCIVASVRVHNDEYFIHTDGLRGLSELERELLEKYLESLKLTKREGHVGI